MNRYLYIKNYKFINAITRYLTKGLTAYAIKVQLLSMKKKHKASVETADISPVEDTISQSPSMLSRIDSLLNVLIVFGVVAVITIGGYLAVTRLNIKLPILARQTEQLQVPQNSVAFDNLTIKTDLNKNELEPGVAFLKKTLAADLQPTDITLQTLGNSQTGGDISYVGSWNKNGKFVSFLSGLSPQKKPAYYRVWMMPQGESVTLAQAQSYLKEMFTSDYLNQFTSPLACKDIKAPDNSTVTECAVMKTTDSGDLVGVTVRAPVILEPPPNATIPTGVPSPKVVIVSACLIPKDATAVYPAGSCI